jgi:hypothetical protein
MVDDTGYYEKNTVIAEKIYANYVEPDSQISNEAKAVIRDKLILLA